MGALRAAWLRLRTSLWFVPALVLLASMLLAVLLVDLDARHDLDLAERWPRLFGSGADGARAMLSSIATSVITVAGVVFSITIVVLSQASTQYSPRVLRNFMRDRPTQFVLGVFVGIFVYCLMVLRTVRAEADGAAGFLPSFGVLGGLVLAILGVAVLIYFIHHLVDSIQAASIVERIGAETLESIDRLFPEPAERSLERQPSPADLSGWDWLEVGSDRTGYLLDADHDVLIACACKLRGVVAVAAPIGSFVVEGQPLLRVTGVESLDAKARTRLLRAVNIGRERDVHQDASYGLQQLVDVALRALSPSLNDPTTAIECVDRLCALLVRLAARRVPAPYRTHGDDLRLVIHGPDFEAMAALALDPIARHARSDVSVHDRLLQTLATIAAATREPARRAVLRRRLDVVMGAVERCVDDEFARRALLERGAVVASELREVTVRGHRRGCEADKPASGGNAASGPSQPAHGGSTGAR